MDGKMINKRPIEVIIFTAIFILKIFFDKNKKKGYKEGQIKTIRAVQEKIFLIQLF